MTRNKVHDERSDVGEHFERLLASPDEDHPVDRLVATLAKVRRADRQARRIGRRLATHPSERLDHPTWVRYDDLRLAQRIVRQEAYFDAGWKMGAVAGSVSRTAPAKSSAVRQFTRAVTKLAFTTPLDRDRASSVLLEIARALMIGIDATDPDWSTNKR